MTHLKTQLHPAAEPASKAPRGSSRRPPHQSLWPSLALLAALAFASQPAQAAVTEAWVHRYSNVASNSVDQAFKVVPDAAGDIIVTGTTHDGTSGGILTIKYSGTNGAVLWQMRSPSIGSDIATMAVDGNGNVVVTGGDFYTAKYAATDGALVWERRLNPGDFVRAIAVDTSGNVAVTGTSLGSEGTFDYYTAKYAAANGSLLWEKRYKGTGDLEYGPSAIAVDGAGNVVVTGTSRSDYYTAKYAAADGALLWERRYNGPANGQDQARALAVDGSGNVIVTGDSWNASDADYYTAKYAAADGELLWEKRYNASIDFASAVAVDDGGNVVVTGYSSPGYYTAKYAAADGALLWEKRDDGGGKAVAVDGSGNVVVTGSITGEGGNDDYYTAKYAAANGALLRQHRYNGPANNYDFAQSVAVDNNGSVIVTGSSAGSVGNDDYYTAKYAAANGTLLWEKRYNGLANGTDRAQAVVIDKSGNVVVTGESGHGRNLDYYTAKYAAADGALLWEKRYNGPANGYYSFDFAQAIAVDGDGNVVVTGSSEGIGSYGDYYTAKYAAADGELLWEKRYNASIDFASAVAVDDGGNVVVTGYSSPGYYTAKYAAADGALLWEQRDNGGGKAVAVDGSGNVVVTGYSSSATNTDSYTAKYAAENGALIWERLYNVGYGSPVAMAIDGWGNAVITGESAGDYYTAKYAAEDGTLLWDRRYHGPAARGPGTGDGAKAVAVDGNGNVVVTGYSAAGANGDCYTAKYAAADGAVLWEKRYTGVGQAVALDTTGNVVVAGSWYNTTNLSFESKSDYFTVKYAAADGALHWEKRYNGPANGNDYVLSSRSLALGPNGMVAVTGSSSDDYATVVYRENLLPVSITLVPAGLRLRFIGVPGRSYIIERALVVTGPWSAIATPIAPLDGLIEYTDTNPPVSTAFYRTSEATN